MVTILTDIGDAQLSTTQALIDDVYAQIFAQIETLQATWAKKQARTKNPKPKPAARGKLRVIDMLEHMIPSTTIPTYCKCISNKGYHG